MERYTEALVQLMSRYTQLSSGSKATLIGSAEIVSHVRRSTVFAEGRNDRYEYFLLEGIAHRHNLSADGADVSTGIYYPDSVVTPNFARTINSSSIFSLQTLTEAVFARLPVATFDQLRSTYPDIRQFGQKVVEQDLSRSMLEQTVFRTSTAPERLKQMREAFPGLENQIPLQVIASDLGITPASLSKLRKEA